MSALAPTLRKYQTDALAAICAARRTGQNRLLVKKPTGTGKTVMFAAMPQWPELAAWLNSFPRGSRRMLVIAHREELLDQAADKILKQNPQASVSIEQADRYASPASDIVIASIQTLAASKFRRLHRLLQRGPFRLVIVDEAHHAAASTYRTALVHLGFLPPAEASDADNIEAPSYDDVELMNRALAGWDATSPKDRLLVGVTATPNRSDAIGLGCVFQTIAYSYGLKEAITDKFLVPIVPWVIETKSSLDDVKMTAGDFNQKQLAAAVNNALRNDLAVAAWQEHAADCSTLAFTVDVAHAHAVAASFKQAGVAAEALSGETPKPERRQMLQAFTDGRVQLIANCMVLTEGTDLPRTGCILHLKPTKSATLYEQMTGRGLRIHPGKTACIVIDLVDVARRHSLQAAPVLYGLPPGLKAEKGKTLDQMEDEFDALMEKYPQLNVADMGRKTLAELAAAASTFDIWTVREMDSYGAGLQMQWIRTGDEAFRLQYPWNDATETIVVSKDLLGHFEVRISAKSAQGYAFGPGTAEAPRVLAAGVVTAQAALALAESYVGQERRSVMKLKDRDAPWRGRPASERQIGLLRKLKIPHNPQKLTMGGASDLIDLHHVRRGR